jgi:hypothetical protein
LAEEVGVADVTGVLLDHVDEDPSDTDRVVAERRCALLIEVRDLGESECGPFGGDRSGRVGACD